MLGSMQTHGQKRQNLEIRPNKSGCLGLGCAEEHILGRDFIESADRIGLSAQRYIPWLYPSFYSNLNFGIFLVLDGVPALESWAQKCLLVSIKVEHDHLTFWSPKESARSLFRGRLSPSIRACSSAGEIYGSWWRVLVVWKVLALSRKVDLGWARRIQAELNLHYRCHALS
jgi:hypothetical protein